MVHEDEDLPERAGLLRRPGATRGGEPVDQRDLARRVRASEISGASVADVHQLALERLDRGRERVREPLDRAAVRQVHTPLERQADVGLDLAPLDLDAVRLQDALDVVEGLGLARATRLALEG